MSARHPIVAITGSSGAGTSTVETAMSHILRRESFTAAHIEGDSFHRYDRQAMKAAVREAEESGSTLSHFGPEGNLFERLEALFREYGDTGTGDRRHYVHNEGEAAEYGSAPGTFTDWEPLPENTDLLFYEGLHGGLRDNGVDVARHVDLLVGVVPIINLEWIQKIHRDTSERGHDRAAVTETILRRMPDYINYITPPVHLERHQLPAGTHGGHFQPVHRPGYSQPGREHGRGAFPGPAEVQRRFLLPAFHALRQLHVAAQHHRHPRQQDGLRPGADPAAGDRAAGAGRPGAAPAGALRQGLRGAWWGGAG